MTPQQLMSLITNSEFRNAGWNIARIEDNPNFTPEMKMHIRRMLPRDKKSRIILREELSANNQNSEWNASHLRLQNVGALGRMHDPRFPLLVRNANMPIDEAAAIINRMPNLRNVSFTQRITESSKHIAYPCLCENPNVTYEVAVRELRRDMKRGWRDSAQALSRNLLQYHHVAWRTHAWLVNYCGIPTDLAAVIVEHMGPTEQHTLLPIGRIVPIISCIECGEEIEQKNLRMCGRCSCAINSAHSYGFDDTWDDI